MRSSSRNESVSECASVTPPPRSEELKRASSTAFARNPQLNATAKKFVELFVVAFFVFT